MVRPSWYFLLNLLNAMFNTPATTGAGTTCYCGLFTAVSGTYNVGTTLAQLTEASYSGYARQSLAPGSAKWQSSFESSDGLAVSEAAVLLSFRPSAGNTINQQIIGWFVCDNSTTTTANLLFGEVLAQQVALNSSASACNVAVRFGFDPSANYDTAGVGS
jgi:hypothetical protein